MDPLPRPGVEIVPLTGPLHAFAAELHHRSLTNGLFPRLGERFLRRYYRTFERSPDGVAIVALRDGRPVGAIVGTIDDPGHYRWVVRHCGLELALAGGLALVRRPAVLAGFVRSRALRYLRGAFRLGTGRGSVAPAGHDRPGHIVGGRAVLTHLAVVAEERGNGVGRILTAAFVESVRDSGAGEVAVVAAAGTDAAGFYERLGWLRTSAADDLDGQRNVRLVHP